jgi:hypothetical protein
LVAEKPWADFGPEREKNQAVKATGFGQRLAPGVGKEHQADRDTPYQQGDEQHPANNRHVAPLLPRRLMAEDKFSELVDG